MSLLPTSNSTITEPRAVQQETWINTKWRPMMGYTYMITCITDFIIFPILWSLLQAISGGQVTASWEPLTLKSGGLYHLAMGAVLGIAAWSRGKEKIEGVAGLNLTERPAND